MFKKDVRVLVADDMRGMRLYMSNNLKKLGITNIIEAENGAKAWEIIEKGQKVDLIISDINMPEMTGLELLQKIRESESFKSMPFFLVTAELEAKSRNRAVELMVTEYVTKPFTEVMLKEKLSKIKEFME